MTAGSDVSPRKEGRREATMLGDGMGLSVFLTAVRPTGIFSGSITHNLGKMAREAGIQDYLWDPADRGVTLAGQLIGPLQDGLDALKADPDRFRAHNPPNGWGCYEEFVAFVEQYLNECKMNPDARVSVSR